MQWKGFSPFTGILNREELDRLSWSSSHCFISSIAFGRSSRNIASSFSDHHRSSRHFPAIRHRDPVWNSPSMPISCSIPTTPVCANFLTKNSAKTTSFTMPRDTTAISWICASRRVFPRAGARSSCYSAWFAIGRIGESLMRPDTLEAVAHFQEALPYSSSYSHSSAKTRDLRVGPGE